MFSVSNSLNAHNSAQNKDEKFYSLKRLDYYALSHFNVQIFEQNTNGKFWSSIHTEFSFLGIKTRKNVKKEIRTILFVKTPRRLCYKAFSRSKLCVKQAWRNSVLSTHRIRRIELLKRETKWTRKSGNFHSLKGLDFCALSRFNVQILRETSLAKFCS